MTLFDNMSRLTIENPRAPRNNTLATLPDRFGNIYTYFDSICTMDAARAISEEFAQIIATCPKCVDINYNPRKSLMSQVPSFCINDYFDLIESLGVTSLAREYLPTRSWFMNGTVSSSLLMFVALFDRGSFVHPTAGNFPEDLCYIIAARPE